MKRLALIAGVCLGPVTAFASDSGTTAANFLKLGINPRAIAMGEAQVGLADDVYATYWNPAGLARLQTREAGFVHAELVQDVRSDFAAYAHPTSKWGTFAGSLTHLRLGTFDAFDATGQPTGNVSASDTSVAFSFAHPFLVNRRMGSDFSAGVTGKWIQESLDTVTAQAYAFDAGLLYCPGRRFGEIFDGTKAGVTVRNIGSPLKFDRDASPLPRSLTAGLSWTGVWLGEKLTLAIDGQKPNDGKESFGVGGELSSLRLLLLRLGFTSRSDVGTGLRMGVGLRLRTLQVDYAFASAGDLGQTHRVGFTLRLGIAPPDPLVLGQDAYHQGMKAYRKSHYPEALVEFNKALELDPTHPEALRMMKETHEKLKASLPQ